eukprot:405177-Hanusia_phi.AAC.1
MAMWSLRAVPSLCAANMRNELFVVVGSSRSCAISAHVDGDGEGNQAGGILRGSVYAITGREETIKLMTGLGCQLSPTVHKKVAFVLCDDDALASGTKHVR